MRPLAAVATLQVVTAMAKSATIGETLMEMTEIKYLFVVDQQWGCQQQLSLSGTTVITAEKWLLGVLSKGDNQPAHLLQQQGDKIYTQAAIKPLFIPVPWYCWHSATWTTVASGNNSSRPKIGHNQPGCWLQQVKNFKPKATISQLSIAAQC